MLLKRIEMQGFKSFADKTVLDFGNGTTAVVGPNGSGKSNISDAIRWVIGETKAKSLRGSSMHDVIFAGTQTRKPLNYAEVSLVLDNSSHIFPLEYDEIVVTRRLFRSGESVYQINRANCLLKNIHELFMDTGLGRDGYSIVGQGNVSQILSTKAEDRRSLFEEAAGVSKYKYRKDEATRKLGHAEENLIRINDIVNEIEGQIAPLRRQSEKARKYIELYGEYKTLDVNMSLVTLDKNASDEEKAAKLHESVSEELNALREQESETEQKINSLYDKNKETDAKQSSKNEQLRENDARLLGNENDIKIAENNIKNNHAVINRIDNEIESIKQRNIERGAQIEELNVNISDAKTQAEEILKTFDALKEEGEGVDKEIGELQAAIDEKRSETVKFQNDAVSMREKIAGIETLRASLLERREALEAEIKSYKEGISNTKQQIADGEAEAKEKREKHEKTAATVRKLQERSDTFMTKSDEIAKKLSELNIDYNSKLSKKRILEGMKNTYEGYARSVKLVLKSEQLKGCSIYGTLSGLIDVSKKYVTAIETALGNALQNIVVESEDDAREAIEYLRQEKGGRATFLPISSVRSRTLENADGLSGCTGYIAIASELVDCTAKYRDIVENLLGRTVVVDNIENAIAISKKFGYKFKIVTLEGDVANTGGSISGGSVNKQSGFLARTAEIKTLTDETAKLLREIRETEEAKKKNDSELETVNNQLSSYIPIMREYEDELLRIENTIAHLTASIENADDNDSHAAELNQLETQLKDSSEEIAVLLSTVRASENAAEAGNNEVAKLEEKYREILTVKQDKTREIMDETIKLANIENSIKAAEASIADINAEKERSKSEIQEKLHEKERLCTENDKTYADIREKTELTEQLKVDSMKLKDEIAEIGKQKEAIARTLQEIQQSNKDLTDKLLHIREELSRIEARQEKLEMQKESILNRLWDEYELTYSDAVQARIEVEDEKKSFNRLSELKAQIKSLGSVNVDAIEEYTALKERYEFLSTQKADLEKSKDNLNKIISSMEELMKEHFGERFTEINKSFSEVFKELFGGGSGRLYLSDPDNLLESGIEIEVQLPGKGLQNINLYSGGEKSFIAIALLFAILRVRPTPFCILDEIDAALDDVNVSRFATYLKNYTDNTQFIIITHRRGSMEAANILYGVTMQEKGVSKLLSLMIDDIDDELIQ